MGIHFDTYELAVTHLQTHGFEVMPRQPLTDSWVWRSETVQARIKSFDGSKIVMILFWDTAA